jgi:hypothetical protein
MAVERRTLWLALAAALVVAAVVWTSGGSSTPRGPTAPRTPAGRSGGAANAAAELPGQVQLDALKVQRAEPGDSERNPFRFQTRVAPRPDPEAFSPTTPVKQGADDPVTPAVPTGPPPPPPIPLKFIGVVTQGDRRVAVLSDGKSPVSGTEGAIILGQYRILKIGTESIEMAYVDGRGRQTIRLTGQ